MVISFFVNTVGIAAQDASNPVVVAHSGRLYHWPFFFLFAAQFQFLGVWLVISMSTNQSVPAADSKSKRSEQMFTHVIFKVMAMLMATSRVDHGSWELKMNEKML